ncbi:MAG: hypothetical protein IJU99_07120 [Lachnospiraceae bacterium]|nr:hypothetical protein [Lachnospiraceae bacterium]
MKGKKPRRNTTLRIALRAVLVCAGLFLLALFYRPRVTLSPYTVVFQEREITGTYEGQTRFGRPDGRGRFATEKGDVVYEGGFRLGEFYGEGRLHDEHFVQDFPGDLVTRIGVYDGEMLDGEASGQATFRTQNKAYDWYTFTGTYAHGLWNGQGILKYDDPFYFVREGNWVDCEFVPTVEEFFRAYGTWQGMPYALTEETAAWMREHGEAMIAEPESFSAVREASWENLSDACEPVSLTGLTIVENERNDVLWGRDFMNICAEDAAGQRYHLLALRSFPVGWNYTIRAVVIPLALSSYPDEHAQKRPTWVCAVIDLSWEK